MAKVILMIVSHKAALCQVWYVATVTQRLKSRLGGVPPQSPPARTGDR